MSKTTLILFLVSLIAFFLLILLVGILERVFKSKKKELGTLLMRLVLIMLAFMFTAVFLIFVFYPGLSPSEKIRYLTFFIGTAILLIYVFPKLLQTANEWLYRSFLAELDEKLKQLGFETKVYLKPLIEFPRGKHVKAIMFHQGNYFPAPAILNEIFVEGRNQKIYPGVTFYFVFSGYKLGTSSGYGSTLRGKQAIFFEADLNKSFPEVYVETRRFPNLEFRKFPHLTSIYTSFSGLKRIKVLVERNRAEEARLIFEKVFVAPQTLDLLMRSGISIDLFNGKVRVIKPTNWFKRKVNLKNLLDLTLKIQKELNGYKFSPLMM